MQYKNNTKQRFNTIQGLRSLKDTLPKNIKKVINNRGQVYSEILNNWKIIAGESLFKVCYPKSFKSSNKFGIKYFINNGSKRQRSRFRVFQKRNYRQNE